MKYGLVLLSGGLDSTTVATYARDQVDELTALTFNYGQTHNREVKSAQAVAEKLGIGWSKAEIPFIQATSWYCYLTNPDKFNLPSERKESEMSADIPITYVPMRNTILLAIAAGALESTVLNAIETKGVKPITIEEVILYAGPNFLDFSGYPDCRPEFYEALDRVLHQGSKISQQYGIPFKVRTPIIQLNKKEIVEMGIGIGAPLELTWSCYEGKEIPCDKCDSCILRAKGFAEAGIIDPAMERLGRT